MVGLDNPLHILLVLVVVLMVFGAKRLPEMGRGVGEGMRSFKQAIGGETADEPQPTVPHPQPLALSAVEEPVPAAATSRETASRSVS